MTEYKIEFMANGNRQKWTRFYATLADALRDVRPTVEREYGKVQAIILSSEQNKNGWLA